MKKLLLLFTIVSFFSVASIAGDQQIKQRMLDRLPHINAMKDKGALGENNKGFLEFRTADRAGADMVQAENNDRQEVYKMIAQKTGSTPDVVGKARAEQIAKNASKGHWIQNKDGSWHKK